MAGTPTAPYSQVPRAEWFCHMPGGARIKGLHWLASYASNGLTRGVATTISTMQCDFTGLHHFSQSDQQHLGYACSQYDLLPLCHSVCLPLLSRNTNKVVGISISATTAIVILLDVRGYGSITTVEYFRSATIRGSRSRLLSVLKLPFRLTP